MVAGGGTESERRVRRDVAWFVVALALPIAWLLVRTIGWTHDPRVTALVSGLAIFGASFLLSWAGESAQLDIPQALAVAFLALVAVLPEYAVDVYFAWRAGRDPAYTAFATANMTGGNRLLLGVGWAVPVLAVWWKFGRREVRLAPEQRVELRFLAVATLYSFLLPLKGTLSLVDSLVLLALFFGYLWSAAGSHHEEPQIEGPAALLLRLRPASRRGVTIGLFVFAAVAIVSASEPFAESLIATGRRFGVEEFLLVQWVAPLASESPEFIVAILFSLRGAAAAGIGTMISSKVNQWTLLVGALPIAYAVSGGHVAAMQLDSRQIEELFLTSAQSLFGLVVISNFRFNVVEATLLFALFLAQFAFPTPAARWVYGGLYLGLALGLVLLSPGARAGLRGLVGRRR